MKTTMQGRLLLAGLLVALLAGCGQDHDDHGHGHDDGGHAHEEGHGHGHGDDDHHAAPETEAFYPEEGGDMSAESVEADEPGTDEAAMPADDHGHSHEGDDHHAH